MCNNGFLLLLYTIKPGEASFPSHTVIATGSELKMANSFKADSFESALYFLFLSIQQLQMNPRQCTVRVCSAITPQQEETIARFFSGVEKNNLDNLIL